jgi:hypothetical protein
MPASEFICVVPLFMLSVPLFMLSATIARQSIGLGGAGELSADAVDDPDSLPPNGVFPYPLYRSVEPPSANLRFAGSLS